MRLSSEIPLAIELSDPETRQHTVESQIKIGLPFQMRAMREHRGWTQEVVAEKLGTTQNTISRLENPKTGKPTIKTLLRYARVFDVGLLVRFVPFGFYGTVIESMDQTHVEVPSYDEELHDELRAEMGQAVKDALADESISHESREAIIGSSSGPVHIPANVIAITTLSGWNPMPAIPTNGMFEGAIKMPPQSALVDNPRRTTHHG